MERANLKSRRPEEFSRLQAAWQAWNETTLPEWPDTFSETYDGSRLADHFGVQAPTRTLFPPATAGETPP